jgi:hypothetical protein
VTDNLQNFCPECNKAFLYTLQGDGPVEFLGEYYHRSCFRKAYEESLEEALSEHLGRSTDGGEGPAD